MLQLHRHPHHESLRQDGSITLQVRNLSKSFGGVQALLDVNFDLQAGELVAMIGPNGAGKSTCFNIINGQLRPDAGSVKLFGRESVGLKPRRIFRLGVGRTFQTAAVFNSMTVLENLQLVLLSHQRRAFSLKKQLTGQYKDEALALIDLVGVSRQTYHHCGTLSYGDLKRVELAMALANRPRLLLMDEPTAGMGADERGRLMTLAAEIVQAQQLSILFTEHDMNVVFKHADRVLVLHHGSIIAQGNPATVQENPVVRQVYLGHSTP